MKKSAYFLGGFAALLLGSFTALANTSVTNTEYGYSPLCPAAAGSVSIATRSSVTASSSGGQVHLRVATQYLRCVGSQFVAIPALASYTYQGVDGTTVEVQHSNPEAAVTTRFVENIENNIVLFYDAVSVGNDGLAYTDISFPLMSALTPAQQAIYASGQEVEFSLSHNAMVTRHFYANGVNFHNRISPFPMTIFLRAKQ